MRTPGISAFMAAVTLCVHLFALGHMVLFAHVRCPHGALVHGAKSELGTSPYREPAEPALTGVPSAHSDTRDRSHEHDHCGSFATVSGLRTGGSCLDRCEAHPEREAWAIRESEGNAVVGVLYYAPKTSPTA